MLSGDVEINPDPKSSSRECFSICHWILNSISAQSCTKVSLLTAYNLIYTVDIICVSETFLNSEIAPNGPNLEIARYNMYALTTLPIATLEVYAFSTKQRFF